MGHVCEAQHGTAQAAEAAPLAERERPAGHGVVGTAFHSTEGMQHLDVRQSGNGVVITSSPAEIDGVPASWPLRLRSEVDGGLNEVGADSRPGVATSSA